MRIGLIGLGGMGKVIVSTLYKQDTAARHEIIGAIVAPEELQQSRESNSLDVEIVDDFSTLLALKPDVIVECAGHQAVREHGEQILQAGIQFVVISIGVLADDDLYKRLESAAKTGATSMLLPAGAVGGIDALAAARLAGLNRVNYKARKPAMAWSGTDAEDKFDLAGMTKAECFFRGNAREAALRYPKNSNVAATVALAGLGFDETTVELIADPQARDNTHEVDVDAQSGSFQITLSGLPLKESPKTSALAAYSVAKCLLDLGSAIVI